MLCGSQSQFEASCMSSHTEEMWYNEIYTPLPRVEHSDERINSWSQRNAKLF